MRALQEMNWRVVLFTIMAACIWLDFLCCSLSFALEKSLLHDVNRLDNIDEAFR